MTEMVNEQREIELTKLGQLAFYRCLRVKLELVLQLQKATSLWLCYKRLQVGQPTLLLIKTVGYTEHVVPMSRCPDKTIYLPPLLRHY